MASIADMLIGGYESGRALAKDRRAEQNKSRLAGLFQQAYNAPTPDRGALVSEAIGIDPGAGMAMDASLQKGDTAKAERLYGMSAALMQAPDEMKPQMYAHMVPELRRLGIPAPDQFTPEVVQTAQQVLQAFGGGAEAEQFTLSPGSARYDARGNVIASQPFAPKPERWDLVSVPDGNGGMVQMERNPATGEFRPPSYDNIPLTPPTIGGGNQFAFLGDAGATITSGLRSPERNREVGGVPNSFHLTGQARDILPPTDPQQAAMIRQEAAARGLEIIDEGDHWHLEPRGNAPSGRLGYTPPKQSQGAAPSGYRFRPDGSLEAIPGGPADKPQKLDLTPAQQAVDRAFAKDYVSFIQNGAADAQKAMDELESAISELDERDDITGSVVGALPDFIATRTGFADAVNTRETVEQTVQRSLRAILGAQFTEKEGERLIRRAFNPSLDEATNKQRVENLLTQLRRAYEAKVEASRYYEQNGTLAGFRGPVEFGFNDFNPDQDRPPSGGVDDLLSKYGAK